MSTHRNAQTAKSAGCWFSPGTKAAATRRLAGSFRPRDDGVRGRRSEKSAVRSQAATAKVPDLKGRSRRRAAREDAWPREREKNGF